MRYVGFFSSLAIFSTLQVTLVLTIMRWPTFWATFSQTEMVALLAFYNASVVVVRVARFFLVHDAKTG
jgi:hypothetical protein